MEDMGAAKKVVVFTESRRTQNWLKDFLEGNGYAGQVLTFNGTNKMMPPVRFIESGLPPTGNQVALPALVKWTSERQSLIVSVTRQVS